jgi:predicted ester cyclase
MSTEQNKTVIRHLMESLNTRNMSLIEVLVDQIFSPDFVVHDKIPSGNAINPEGVKKHFRDGLTKTPDWLFTVEDLIAEGDKVVLRLMLQGTDVSTGKQVTSLTHAIYRFNGNMIEELWQIST